MSKQHRYRENIIVNTQQLKRLDGKEINETTRQFIKGLKSNQMNSTTSKRASNMENNVPSFAKRYPLAVQKAVALCITKESKSAQAVERNGHEDDYVAWNALPAASCMNVVELLPPMLKKQRYRRTKNTALMTTTFSQL